MKKALSFLIVCVYVLASIGCMGYLFYFKQPLFAICSIALSVMAFPVFRNAFKEMLK